MPEVFRIATFNLENFDDIPDKLPSVETRIAVMRPQLLRLKADVLCFQEVHGQEQPGQPRRLLALDKLLKDTPYEHYHRISTKTTDGSQVYDKRNLVIISRKNIESSEQIKHDYIDPPKYKKVTAIPSEDAKDVEWERPILKAKINISAGKDLHILNLHLKSKLPSTINGQKKSQYVWKNSSSWAEGYFLSSMKRVGQALEARKVIDGIFDTDPNAYIVICGDFNAVEDSVPVKAIRGAVEQTGNPDLASRELFSCENGVAKSARYSLFHQGRGEMIDHLLVSRNMVQYFNYTKIHNEMLHDESKAFTNDKLFPESDHAPVVVEFEDLS